MIRLCNLNDDRVITSQRVNSTTVHLWITHCSFLLFFCLFLVLFNIVFMSVMFGAFLAVVYKDLNYLQVILFFKRMQRISSFVEKSLEHRLSLYILQQMTMKMIRGFFWDKLFWFYYLWKMFLKFWSAHCGWESVFAFKEPFAWACICDGFAFKGGFAL